jgi:hypothetical protein
MMGYKKRSWLVSGMRLAITPLLLKNTVAADVPKGTDNLKQKNPFKCVLASDSGILRQQMIEKRRSV